MNTLKKLLVCLVACPLFFFSCQTIDLYEKTVTIPGHNWKSSFKPSFTFTIKETEPAYQLYVILRHRDKYNYNNIYMKITTRQPEQDSTQSALYDLKLGSDDTGWLGSGMDDIYEHRIALTPAGMPFRFRKPGDYIFTIEQVMREDPLENVMNVGLRIEKK
jgi:gliding motility-associated lipoprotein GldH